MDKKEIKIITEILNTISNLNLNDGVYLMEMEVGEDDLPDIFKQDLPNRPTCVLCGEKCECPWGNSPYPLANEGRCCGKCNLKVIMARMERVGETETEPEPIKKVVRK